MTDFNARCSYTEWHYDNYKYTKHNRLYCDTPHKWLLTGDTA